MRQKYLLLFALFFACNVCFAKISVISFEIYEATDYDDMDDNLLVFNKTNTNIARVFLYGIKESNCLHGFNLDDFIAEKDDNRVVMKESAELICMLKDIKKNNHVKKYLTEQLIHKYRYFILVIDGMMPEGYDYQIRKMFARHDDFYIHIGDNYDRNSDRSERSYYTTESSSSRTAESISNITKSLEQGMKELNNSVMNNLRNQPCGACRGNGNCSTCGGTGKYSGNECPYCHGSGVCKRCNGTGKAHAF